MEKTVTRELRLTEDDLREAIMYWLRETGRDTPPDESAVSFTNVLGHAGARVNWTTNG